MNNRATTERKSARVCVCARMRLWNHTAMIHNKSLMIALRFYMEQRRFNANAFTTMVANYLWRLTASIQLVEFHSGIIDRSEQQSMHPRNAFSAKTNEQHSDFVCMLFKCIWFIAFALPSLRIHHCFNIHSVLRRFINVRPSACLSARLSIGKLQYS